jgi:acetylglutamate kinase
VKAPVEVLKVGGSELAREGFAADLAAVVASLVAAGGRAVVVHGGGPEIDALLARLGIERRFFAGQRVTDQPTLDAVEMMLSGHVNKRLVALLLAAGVDAVGLSGVDRGLVRVEPWSAALGRVGRVVAVRGEVLEDLLAAGVVPVLSPISLGDDGPYNVNADHVAAAVAVALGAARLTFLTNVPGVKVGARWSRRLAARRAPGLMARGVIRDGMVPKVEAALGALGAGVGEVRITDLSGLAAGGGTALVA